MAPREVGKLAAMEVKMSSDMPLPTPFSVTSSPIHMIRPVPAVSVMMIRMVVITLLSGMIVQRRSPEAAGRNAPATPVSWR